MSDLRTREWSCTLSPKSFYSEEFKANGETFDYCDVALTQFGKCEANGDDDKYIKWYNQETRSNFAMDVSWCSIFASWCMREFEDSYIFSNCEQGLKLYWKDNKFYLPSEGLPKRDDIFFITNNATREKDTKTAFNNTLIHPTHVGFVLDVNEKEGYFTSIEGNYSDAVKMVNRYLDSPNLVGFGNNQ